MATNLIPNQKGMTSLEIAEVTQKRHDAILRDIRSLLKKGVAAHNFVETYYTDKSNRQSPCFSLTPKGCLILASGYDALLRERIINRLEELEKTKKDNWNIPQSYSEALLLASNLQHTIEEQQVMIEDKQRQIDILQPKITFANCFLHQKGDITIKALANILNQSGLFSKGSDTLKKWMRDNGWLLKRGIDKNKPTQKSMERKLMRLNSISYNQHEVFITANGQKFFITEFRRLRSNKESYEIEW